MIFNYWSKGDLNEQERADIQEFLKSAKTIFEELANGNSEEATKAAATLINLDTLSQAALFVRQSTTVSVATQSTSLAALDGTGLVNGIGQPSPSRPEGSNALDQILNRLRETQDRFRIDQEQLLTRLPRLATTLLQTLKEDSEAQDSDEPLSILEQIRKEFIDSLLASTQSPKPDQNAEPSLEDSTHSATPDSNPPHPTGPGGNSSLVEPDTSPFEEKTTDPLQV